MTDAVWFRKQINMLTESMEDAFNDPTQQPPKPVPKTPAVSQSAKPSLVTLDHKTGDPAFDSVVEEIINLYAAELGGELDYYEDEDSDDGFYIDDDTFSDTVSGWSKLPENRDKLDNAGLVDSDDFIAMPKEPTPPREPNRMDMNYGTKWANAAYQQELRNYERQMEAYEDALEDYEESVDHAYYRACRRAVEEAGYDYAG